MMIGTEGETSKRRTKAIKHRAGVMAACMVWKIRICLGGCRDGRGEISWTTLEQV